MPCQLDLRLILFLVKVSYLQIAPNPNKGWNRAILEGFMYNVHTEM